MRNTREGVFNALANVWWNDVKVVVSKAIERTEEASGDRGRVPAGVGVVVRAGIGNAEEDKGGEELGPAIFPASKRDPGGPEHSSKVNC